ncbi:uncharacterized protein [Amphiura filiformis]|uniref:uncharacterized protein n=1 Tax=Amphiura filiformis TaxID=82378 RepID=UPI003B22125E
MSTTFCNFSQPIDSCQAQLTIPVRHTFTLEQKRILMRHYETGMTGQSLAYHSRIMQCAQEAGVDFDIVRNWIGNMRRKKRMEEAQMVMPMHNYMAIPHTQSPENVAKRVRLMSSLPRPGGPYFVNVHSPTGIPMIRGGQGVPPPHMGVPGVPLEAHLPPRNTPLSPRDQNIAHVGTIPQMQANRAMAVAKREAGEDRNGGEGGDSSVTPIEGQQHQQHQQQQQQQQPQQADTPKATPASSASGENSASQDGQLFPDDTAPVVAEKGQEGMSAEELEWKQHEVNRILDNIQQSMHQLENLGCECLMATVSPIDNGTYVAGTEKAIKYFTDIQKIQPMSEYVHGSMSPRMMDNMSVFSDDVSDAADERPHSEDTSTKDGHGENQNKASERQANGQGSSSEDIMEEEAGQRSQDGEQNGAVVKKKDQSVIHAGEEVFIVNKEHYIIGTGMLLPTPHKKIELKNFCPAS